MTNRDIIEILIGALVTGAAGGVGAYFGLMHGLGGL